jgi:hypothetical protein
MVSGGLSFPVVQSAFSTSGLKPPRPGVATHPAAARIEISVLSVFSVADFSQTFFCRVFPGIFAARFFTGIRNVD